MNETRELVRLIRSISYKVLPPEVIEKTRGLVLDQLGCQLTFAGLPWGRQVFEYIRGRQNPRGESSLTFYGLKTIAEDAAFANAVFGHGFEMDDTELFAISHPGSVVIPAALALGEAAKIPGTRFIEVIVAGYEAMIRAGVAARGMVKRSFHTTAVAGPFGSTAAAGLVLGLGEDTLVNAMGIAGSECGGLSEYTISGGTVKRLHAGFASQAGVRAALLAKAGLTGPSAVLEGKKGFCQAFSDEVYPEEITSGFGEPFRILRTGNKPYCCCAAQHTTIDATAALMKERPMKPDEIESITVSQASREAKNVGNIVEPEDIVASQFSGRFGVALRLVKGGNGFNEYNEKNLRDPTVRGLARKVSYEIDEEFERMPLGAAPARVTIRLKDGSILEKQVDYARGTIQNPMTLADLEEKFLELTARAISPGRAESIVRMVADLEEIEDISQLTSLLVSDV